MSLIDRVMTLRKSETSSSPGSLHMSETDLKHWLVPTREEKLPGTWFLHFQFPLSQVHISVLFRTQYVKELEPPMFTLEFFIINITIPNSWCSKFNPVHTLLSICTKKFINWLPINIQLSLSLPNHYTTESESKQTDVFCWNCILTLHLSPITLENDIPSGCYKTARLITQKNNKTTQRNSVSFKDK